MPDVRVADLQHMSVKDLIELARSEGLNETAGLKKQELIHWILKERIRKRGNLYGEGVLEVLPDGFGFLRSPEYSYLASPNDIYVSPSQIKRFGLITGDTVSGQVRPPKEDENYFALIKVLAVNFDDPEHVRHRINFDNLTPLYPEEKLGLEFEDPKQEGKKNKDLTCRVIELVAPLGKGTTEGIGEIGFVGDPVRTPGGAIVPRQAAGATHDVVRIGEIGFQRRGHRTPV